MKFNVGLTKKSDECFFCQGTPVVDEVYVCYKCHKKFRKGSTDSGMVFDNICKKYDEELRERLREKRLSKIENILL